MTGPRQHGRMNSRMRHRLAPLAGVIAILSLPATAQALSLGIVTIRSAPGEPLSASAAVHADGGAVTAGVSVLGAPAEAHRPAITAHYDAADRRLILSSKAPVTVPHLLVRLWLRQGAVAFNGTYDLTADSGARRVVDALPDHVYAGQLSAAAAGDHSMPRAGQTYGPVAAGTTLIQIADRLAADRGSSRTRFALALFLDNPRQFVDRDPRRLRPAAILRIPDPVTVQLADGTAADHLQRYLKGRAAQPLPTAVTPTPRHVPAWERALLSALATLYQQVRTITATPLGMALLVTLSALLSTVLLRRSLASIALALRRRRWVRRQAAERHCDAAAAAPTPAAQADAVARLQALLQRHPERDDIRMRLVERLSQSEAREEFFTQVGILRERLSEQQFQHIRRVAQRAGIFDPRALGY